MRLERAEVAVVAEHSCPATGCINFFCPRIVLIENAVRSRKVFL